MWGSAAATASTGQQLCPSAAAKHSKRPGSSNPPLSPTPHGQTAESAHFAQRQTHAALHCTEPSLLADDPPASSQRGPHPLRGAGKSRGRPARLPAAAAIACRRLHFWWGPGVQTGHPAGPGHCSTLSAGWGSPCPKTLYALQSPTQIASAMLMCGDTGHGQKRLPRALSCLTLADMASMQQAGKGPALLWQMTCVPDMIGCIMPWPMAEAEAHENARCTSPACHNKLPEQQRRAVHWVGLLVGSGRAMLWGAT